MLIVLENHEYSSIVGSSAAPYINGTLIPDGKLFTNYVAVSHPSLPNYLAMTSGSTDGKSGTDAITAGEINVENLFNQLSTAGTTWKSFEETMPSACYKSSAAGSAPYEYVLKHDPAMAYSDIAKTSACNDVVRYSQLSTSSLPAFSFITPNECDDMHSCSVQNGDAWLKSNVPALLRAGSTVLVVFDEGTTNTGGGGHVLALENGPSVAAGTRDSTSYTHYSLLAGVEKHFGVALLQNAKTATPLPL